MSTETKQRVVAVHSILARHYCEPGRPVAGLEQVLPGYEGTLTKWLSHDEAAVHFDKLDKTLIVPRSILTANDPAWHVRAE